MNNDRKESKFRGLIIFNKYTYIFIFIYFLLGVGITYSYFAFQVEEEEIIVGNVISIDADLEVELVVGTTNKMVPMMNNALSNAINGVGSPNGACIDSAGNLSCQVYKITLTNNGSRLKHITGTVELYAKNGVNNAYNNLKWRELTNTTTVKEDSFVHNMDKSILVSDITMESKEVKTWYIAVWIGEIDADQTNSDKGQFGGTVTFESIEPASNVFTETILEPNAETDANIDFSVVSSTSGTNGIYLRSGTENNANPIYYYRGAVDNNLIFANFCWKVVRTTETGGLKLIYNGVPTNGTCNNTGTATTIGYKAFNSNSNSPAYVGYMYGTPYTTGDYIEMLENETYLYGNDVTYSNGQYTLVNTIQDSILNVYDGGLDNYHYTCFSTEATCTNVSFIYSLKIFSFRGINYYDAYYITLTGGKKIGEALNEMLGADDGNSHKYNTTSSTIKGNKDTEGTLDWWYYNNIALKGYSSYIEDTVWCNDRSIYDLGGFNPNGGLIYSTSVRTYSVLGASGRIEFSETVSPSLTCPRNIDSFTVNEYNGNGDLDYPVGLLTGDEIVFAGASLDVNEEYYLYTGEKYWVGSPGMVRDGYAHGSDVDSNGFIEFGMLVYAANGVRPSISLAPGFSLAGNGNGSVTNPYIVE